MLLRSCILAFALLLSACAAPGVREVIKNSQLPRHYELTETPFFPQQKYHCGPAALSTALQAVDISVTPDQLAPEVYIPSRKGSLQIEMLAAARRHGALPVKIAPKLDALFKELAAGNVVVVMQNLGLSWVPAWHYAVVVGYDLDKELVWLRSGTEKRFEMSMSTFQRTWARSQYWAFVALKPGSLPASAEPEAMIQALISFEKTAFLRSASDPFLDKRHAPRQRSTAQHQIFASHLPIARVGKPTPRVGAHASGSLPLFEYCQTAARRQRRAQRLVERHLLQQRTERAGPALQNPRI